MHLTPTSDPPAYVDELSPREWWALLVRQRRIAAGAATLVALGGLVVSVTARPLYRSRVRVVVAAPVPQPQVAGELPVLSVGENAATQVELLQSEGLLERARRDSVEEGDADRFHVRIENTPGSDVIDVVAEGPRAEGVAALANALIVLHVADGDQSRASQVRSLMAFLIGERTASKAELDRVDRRLKLLEERQKKSAGETSSPPAAADPERVRRLPPGTETPELTALWRQIQETAGKIARLQREQETGAVPTGKLGGHAGAASVLPDVWSRGTVLEQRLGEQQEKYRQIARVTVERVTASRIETELRQLRHRREAAQATLRATSERIVELRARGAAAGKPFRSVEPARVPARPFWPDPRVQFSVTLLGAAAAGVLAAVVRERRVARVRTADQVERLGLSLLGTVSGGGGPVTEQELDASWQDCLDGLEFAGVGRSVRVLGVAPVSQTAGSSGVGEALAAMLARSGKTVVWVDADLRARMPPSGFPPPRRGLGLSQVLAGIRGEEQVIEAGEVAGLWCLPAGPPPPNPLDLLGSQAAGALLERLRERFEIVVMTAHPCLDRPDALRLAAKVDGVVLTADRERLRPAELGRAAEAVRGAGGVVLGAVLEQALPPGVQRAARRDPLPPPAAGIYRKREQQDDQG